MLTHLQHGDEDYDTDADVLKTSTNLCYKDLVALNRLLTYSISQPMAAV